MATPAKTYLLCSKILSPKLLSPLNNIKSENFSDKFARKLSFSPDPKSVNKLKCGPNVKITVTDYSKDVFDTPKRRNLLKSGAENNGFSVIGKGAFSTVIRGIYKGKKTAAKVVKKSRILGEYNALNLCHENIIKTIEIISTDEENGLIFMEFYEGSQQLQTILDNPNFSMDKKCVIEFSKQIANGVEFCHRNGILHLDLKPKNVMYCNGVCKVCDFGNSVRISEISDFFHYKGTVAYTCPEILKGYPPSTKSDVYSLGVFFWQIKTRCMPYNLINNEIVIYKVVKYNLRPPDCLKLKEEQDNFSQLYQLCWQQNPLNRPNVAEILNILKEMC